eukprot:scaffold1213_cov256-Pinguiococcus_pyrenoidosus.AAC.4
MAFMSAETAAPKLFGFWLLARDSNSAGNGLGPYSKDSSEKQRFKASAADFVAIGREVTANLNPKRSRRDPKRLGSA